MLTGESGQEEGSLVSLDCCPHDSVPDEWKKTDGWRLYKTALMGSLRSGQGLGVKNMKSPYYTPASHYLYSYVLLKCSFPAARS